MHQVETPANTYRRNRVHFKRTSEQPQARSEHEAPAEHQTDRSSQSMTVVTPHEPVIVNGREQTATLPSTAVTTPQRATTVDRVVTRSGRAVTPPARYEQ